jgi:hypothetical protein
MISKDQSKVSREEWKIQQHQYPLSLAACGGGMTNFKHHLDRQPSFNTCFSSYSKSLESSTIESTRSGVRFEKKRRDLSCGAIRKYYLIIGLIVVAIVAAVCIWMPSSGMMLGRDFPWAHHMFLDSSCLRKLHVYKQQQYYKYFPLRRASTKVYLKGCLSSRTSFK